MKKILLVNDTRVVGHHGSSTVVDVILQQFARRGIEVCSDLQHGIDLESIETHGYHGVVINGEGAMHSGQKNSHLFSRIGQQMHERQVPVFLINTVFDERTPEIVGRMKHFTSVYCREMPSVERLRARGVDAKLCPDLTFALQVPEGLAWRPGERIVVLDSTVAGINRTLRKFCIDSGATFQPIRSSPRLLRLTSARNLLRLVRFNASKALGKLLPRCYRFNRYANAVTDRREFLRRISDGTRVVVAARFHGVCFCMKLGVPFLGISSNTPKIEGILEGAGLSGRMLAIDDLKIDLIRERSPWSAADEEHRKRYVGDAQASIARMFDDLARAIP
jgi:hypothetical protein